MMWAPRSLEERRGGPVEGLPDRAAVLLEEARLEVAVADRSLGAESRGLRREGEQQAADEEGDAGVERARARG